MKYIFIVSLILCLISVSSCNDNDNKEKANNRIQPILLKYSTDGILSNKNCIKLLRDLGVTDILPEDTYINFEYFEGYNIYYPTYIGAARRGSRFNVKRIQLKDSDIERLLDK